jgi:tetratricopeptide (TPR) repeat protein
MEKLAEEGVKIPGVLADDTSGLYGDLAGVYRDAKDEEAATRTATAWLEFLRRQIAQAPDAGARMGYEFHLALAAGFLHKPELALADVERSERELPEDYNPPRVLASLLQQMGQYDESLAASDRAFAKAYGPAKLRVYLTKARTLELKGDPAAARKLYAEAITYGRTLPEAMARPYMEQLEKAAGALENGK